MAAPADPGEELSALSVRRPEQDRLLPVLLALRSIHHSSKAPVWVGSRLLILYGLLGCPRRSLFYAS